MRLSRIFLVIIPLMCAVSLPLQIWAQTPGLEWAIALGGTGNDEGRSIATDLAGNVFTTGRFNGTADFDPGTGTFNLTSAGSDDIFISKLDATGNFVWAISLGSTSSDQGRSIAIDPFGNILVTGEFRNTIDFDPGAGIFNLTAPSGLYDIYVLKLDGNGNFLWAASFGDPASNSDIGYAIDTDATGNVYVTGIYSGTADFDPGVGTFPLTALGPAGFPEVFILKLSAAGNFVWAKSIGGTAQDHAYGISIDPMGNVIVGGDFIGTVDFDPGAGTANLTPIGFLDPFILKLDGDGNFVWAKSFGGGASEQIWAVTTDTNGNIFATGDFQGSIDLDPGVGTFIQLDAGTGPGSGDIFILKLDVNGNFLWGAGFGDNQIDRVRGAAVDGSGNSYFTGYFRGTVDFDPGAGVFNLSSTPSTASDIFISKYDPSGNLIWAGSMGGTSDFEIGNSITVSAGNIYATGAFFNTADFDPGSGTFNLIGNGSFVDAFVVKLSPAIPTIPTIISFNPLSGPVGTTVTITGTNFSAVPTNNIVYFGATRAAIISATPTQLTVNVPVGTTYEPVTIQVNGLTGYSSKSFITTFTGGGTINACSFASKVDFPTGTYPVVAAVCDFDGDGKADLATANGSSNNVSVFRNTSTGAGIISYASKIDFASGTNPPSIATGDLDGDGKPDIIVVNRISNTVSVFRSTSSGTGVISYAAKMDFATGSDPFSVSIADMDGDGWIDIAVANITSNTVSVLRNTSTGVGNISFAAKVDFGTGATPYTMSVRDLDGDGKPDIVTPNSGSNTVSIFLNISTGAGNINFASKSDFPTGTGPFSISIGDLDGDSKADLAITNRTTGTISIFRNTSSGSGNINYAPKVDFILGTDPIWVSLGDLDGDGKVDLAVANFNSASVSILRNLSSGAGNISFATRVDFTTGSSPRSVAMGDFDGDGKPDLIVANATSNTFSAFLNTIGNIPPPTLTSFSPTSGLIGTTVTINGTNFSATSANNLVKFNGVTALVTASSATNITTTVPIGTTTGLIEVTVGCNTVISSSDFTVASPSIITITQQPTSPFYACEGSTATLSTDASGTTNITYQWQKFNSGTSLFENLVNNTTYSGVSTKTLSIVNVTSAEGGDYRCLIKGDLAADVTTNVSNVVFNSLPSPPDVVSSNSCGPGSVTLTASGGSPGDYQWYTTSPLTLINGEINETYTTPVLSTPTQYAVTVKDLFCASLPVNITAVINPLPTKPIVTSSIDAVGNALTICSTTTLTLTAPVGLNSYLWSDGSITQQISVAVAGTYSVVVKDTQGCSSPASDGLTVTIVQAPCNNSAPVIDPTSTTTTIGVQTSINLLDLISDVDNNLVPSSLMVLVQPISGAATTITNGILLIDYTGINFTGIDQLTIQVCDVFGECSQQVIEVDVIGDIEIYNAVSPNKDGLNDIFYIEYIDLIPETQKNKVSIYNRWGSKVFEVENYNNTDRVFKGLNENGNELPSGTYFYKIQFTSGRSTESGYLALKR